MDILTYSLLKKGLETNNFKVLELKTQIEKLQSELDFIKDHCLLYEEFKATNNTGSTTISATIKSDNIISCTGIGTISYISFMEVA